MNLTITMGQASVVRASRALTFLKDVRKACAKALAFARSKSVTLLVISTAAVYAGIISGSDILTYSAAFAALGAVSSALSATKGGEK